jgi:diguanylate cyclase (GGDEF)-like protein/PAS domain S-box-containing protein
VSVTWIVLAAAVLTRVHLLQRGWEAARGELARSQDRLASLVANTGDTVLLVTTPAGAAPHVAFVSPACRRLTGRSPDGVRASPLEDLVEIEDRHALLTLVTGGAALPRIGDLRVRHTDGSHRWVEAIVDVAPQEEERSVVLTLRDVDERKRAALELAEVALRDDLTGLWNRRGLYGLLNAALAAPADPASSVAVVLGDLDGFKDVNDRAGHAAGDAVLRALAGRLQGAIRDGDAVGRIGGDEFLVVCEVDGPATLASIADRVVAVGREPIHVDGAVHHLGISVGVAVAQADTSVSELLGRADVALYEAKAAGKGRVRFADGVGAG